MKPICSGHPWHQYFGYCRLVPACRRVQDQCSWDLQCSDHNYVKRDGCLNAVDRFFFFMMFLPTYSTRQRVNEIASKANTRDVILKSSKRSTGIQWSSLEKDQLQLLVILSHCSTAAILVCVSGHHHCDTEILAWQCDYSQSVSQF